MKRSDPSTDALLLVLIKWESICHISLKNYRTYLFRNLNADVILFIRQMLYREINQMQIYKKLKHLYANCYKTCKWKKYKRSYLRSKSFMLHHAVSCL